jgi:hypothetical protein
MIIYLTFKVKLFYFLCAGGQRVNNWWSPTYRVLSIVPQYKNTGKPGLAETG